MTRFGSLDFGVALGGRPEILILTLGGVLAAVLIGCGGGADWRTAPLEDPHAGPAAGNPAAPCAIPAEGGALPTDSPDVVIGDGTPESCTSDAVVAAVAEGGVITFDCGDEPVVIPMEETARVRNDGRADVVIDGGGRVALSGMGERRILYMNTCDPNLVWTTPNCDDQDHPRLTVQNLVLVDGNARRVPAHEDEGGGAIYARGGRLRIVNSRFFNNVCDPDGADVGGAAVRALDQFEDRPVFVTNSTFGGPGGYGNACANGGGVSSIGVSWTITNSLFSSNVATGVGGNPAQRGTPGGGSGGAIYNDGDRMSLSLCGTILEDNQVNAHGSAIFFVSNDMTGDIALDRTIIRRNEGGSWYAQPGISMHENTTISIVDSTLTE